MLNTDPAVLMDEIRRAEDLRKEHLRNTRDLVKRYVGNWFRTTSRTKARPENMIFAYVATMLPNLIFDNPAATVTAKRAVSHAAIATAMKMGLNGWIKDVDLRHELELLAVDMLFGFGVAKVGIEPRGDFDAAAPGGVMENFSMEALTPFGVRVSPANAIIDPDATHWKKARFLGEQFQRDLSSLQGDDRYDQAVVGQLSADDEARHGGSERAMPEARNGHQRGRVTLYELFLPETRQIGTLAITGSGGAWVRPLEDYHGPKLGPYVFFGVYCVPDQVYPLSPIAAIAEQDQELNAHARAAAEEAATGKSLVLVSADQPELAKEIRTAGMNSVVPVKGLNNNMVVPVALGGTTPQRMGYLEMLIQRTDRIAGMSEAARGKAQGVTATEAQLANANSDARTEFLHLKYRDGVKELLTRVGWYLYNDPAVVMPVSDTDPVTGQPFEGLFLGGPQDGDGEGADWSGFLLDIEPMSMRRNDPQQQQQQAALVTEVVTNLCPLVPTMPYLNWQDIFDTIGQAANLPDFTKVIFNQQGLMLLQSGAMMGGGMMPPGPGDLAGGAQPPGPAGLPGGPRPTQPRQPGASSGGMGMGMMGGGGPTPQPSPAAAAA